MLRAEGRPIPQLASSMEPQQCHPVVPTELPRHWDPMPEGADVHEVVIYDNVDGAALSAEHNI